MLEKNVKLLYFQDKLILISCWPPGKNNDSSRTYLLMESSCLYYTPPGCSCIFFTQSGGFGLS